MMQKNRLGETGLQVSRLGLGTVKFGRNQGVKYPTEFQLPDDRQILELLSSAQALGINLLDTAPAYGLSEERLGKLLQGERAEWIISTKAGEDFVEGASHFDFSPAAIQKSVERSLKRLKTDYLDIVLIHSDGFDEKNIQEHAVAETLNHLKQAGKIRATGMSTKTVVGGLLAVDCFDVVMVTYNPLQVEEQPVIKYAYEKMKGVFIKKALASGHMDSISHEDPVKTAMEFVFKEPGVSSVIVGTLSPVHLRHDADCVMNIECQGEKK